MKIGGEKNTKRIVSVCSVMKETEEKYLSKTEEIFAKHRFIGEYDCSDDEYSDMLEITRRVSLECINAYSGCIPVKYYKVIFLTLVEIAKRWKYEDEASDGSDEEDGGGFWNYVFRVILFDEIINQKLYNEFVRIILFLCDKKRPYVTRGKKYYATIMLHALVPASSMNAFFGLCYNLFKNDLDFGDADAEFCHRVAVALREKLGGNLGESAGVAIGSQVYGFKIGLRALILQSELSGEFESICKEIFSYICRRHERKEVSCETRLVNLLDKWWKRKSVDDCQKREKPPEPPVPKRNIQLKYVYENGKVSLRIPSFYADGDGYIRYRAEIFIGQEDTPSRSFDLPLRHGELITVTKQKEVELNDLLKDRKEIDIRVVIREGNEKIYDSLSGLNREFILFEKEREVLKQICRPTNYFIYCKNVDDLSMPASTQRVDADIYNIYPEEGEELVGQKRRYLFLNEQEDRKEKTVRLCGQMPEVEWMFDELSCRIFSSSVKLLVPDGINLRGMRIDIDGGSGLLEEFADVADYADGYINFDLTGSIPAEEPVVIKVYSYVSEQIVLEQAIVRFPQLKAGFNKALYFDDHTDKYFRVAYNGVEERRQWSIEDDEVTMPFGPCGMIVARIPWLKWRIDGGEWTNRSESRVLWCGARFSPSSVIEIALPNGGIPPQDLYLNWGCSVDKLPMSGRGKWPIGRALFADAAKCTVSVGLIGCSGIKEAHLVSIATVECFCAAPLVYENGRVWWRADETFVGDPHPKFRVEFCGDKTYEIADLTAERCELRDLDKDIYKYEVKIERGSLFGKSTNVLFTGELPVGSPEELRFKNKRIVLTSVNLIENGEVSNDWLSLPRGKYIIKDLTLCGDDEALYYKGVICRVNKWDEAIPLGEMHTERRDTVRVNPVRIELRDKKTLWMVAGYTSGNDHAGEFFFNKIECSLCMIGDEPFSMINLYEFKEEKDV